MSKRYHTCLSVRARNAKNGVTILGYTVFCILL